MDIMPKTGRAIVQTSGQVELDAVFMGVQNFALNNSCLVLLSKACTLEGAFRGHRVEGLGWARCELCRRLAWNAPWI